MSDRGRFAFDRSRYGDSYLPAPGAERNSIELLWQDRRRYGLPLPPIPHWEDPLQHMAHRLENSLTDLRRVRAEEDIFFEMAIDRQEYERPPDMSLIDDMLVDFDHDARNHGLVLDRGSDVFDPSRGSGYVHPSIEREPDPENVFYSEPQRQPPRRPSASITSGYRLPPGARSHPRLPTEPRLQGHMMGGPEANMLLGARPMTNRSGTLRPRR